MKIHTQESLKDTRNQYNYIDYENISPPGQANNHRYQEQDPEDETIVTPVIEDLHIIHEDLDFDGLTEEEQTTLLEENDFAYLQEFSEEIPADNQLND